MVFMSPGRLVSSTRTGRMYSFPFSRSVRKQKTDRQDAQFLLKLLLEDRFPRVWVPDPENRDLRQLLWHRHRLVQMRTRIMNQLQSVAMNEGIQRRGGLRSKQGR